MNLRIASMGDLPQLKEIYTKIICNMNKNNIQIWDEVYPCDFFQGDIENHCLYVLEDNNEIVSAFTLCDSNAGEDFVQWENKSDKALYIDRFGVNVNYLGKGIGGLMLDKANSIAKSCGAKYLRLFVVDINTPAINLYVNNKFKKVNGIYDQVIDKDFILHEFGFEKKL